MSRLPISASLPGIRYYIWQLAALAGSLRIARGEEHISSHEDGKRAARVAWAVCSSAGANRRADAFWPLSAVPTAELRCNSAWKRNSELASLLLLVAGLNLGCSFNGRHQRSLHRLDLPYAVRPNRSPTLHVSMLQQCRPHHLQIHWPVCHGSCLHRIIARAHGIETVSQRLAS